ncbi:hypothetical protein HIMB100_00019890 [SAR116 cluster alpha proteobacterium HIMB100]|nr:hypothetical protein HIMB100_00019890 [SAR116 cluster alpha proteobacterium HIMB100]
MPFIDILIFAAIALFLIFRLRSILGNRDGFEQKRPEQSAFDATVQTENDNSAPKKIVPLRANNSVANGEGLEAVRRADLSFKDDDFMQGAAGAFSLILQAFADGDLATLRRLLAFELYEEFASSVHTRNKEGDQLAITVQSIDDVQLIDATVKDFIASVTVKFVSQQSRVVTDKDGQVIDDEAEEKATITDIWVFERDTQLNDPNWKLVETQTEDDS